MELISQRAIKDHNKELGNETLMQSEMLTSQQIVKLTIRQT